MKKMISMLLLFAASTLYVNAQTENSHTEYPKANAVTEQQTAPKPLGKEVKLQLINDGLGQIIVFAGPREEIRNPKVNTYGGLSTNTLYLREGEVVCLMTSDMKMKSCSVIKEGMKELHINTSATTITPK